MNCKQFHIIGLFLFVSVILYVINISFIKIMLNHFIIGQKNLIQNINSGKVNQFDYIILSLKYFVIPLIILFICIIYLEIYLDKGINKHSKIKKENFNEYQQIKDIDEEKYLEI